MIRHRQAEQPQRNHATTRTSNKVNQDQVNKARLILTSEFFFIYLKKNVGNISEDMKGAGELKILQGTHVFSQIDGGRENTMGDSKNPPGTSKGDFHGVCSRGV